MVTTRNILSKKNIETMEVNEELVRQNGNQAAAALADFSGGIDATTLFHLITNAELAHEDLVLLFSKLHLDSIIADMHTEIADLHERVIALETAAPAEYTPLSYVRSNGNAWIDTDLNIDGNLKVAFEGHCTVAQPTVIFTAKDTGTGERIGCILMPTSHRLDHYWQGVPYTNLVVDADIDFMSDFIIVQDMTGVSIEQNGLITQNFYLGEAYTVADGADIYLGHSEQYNHSTYNHLVVKRALFELSNTVLRDFRPYRRNADGVASLYDVVNNEFYTSNGPQAWEGMA